MDGETIEGILALLAIVIVIGLGSFVILRVVGEGKAHREVNYG